jgi:holo-[acyl-carrier protein] synthase
MIVGIGTDCCVIDRIAQAIERHGERFLSRVFTQAEISAESARTNSAAHFAKRFAAKEACAKALGCGIGKSAKWRDIEVGNSPTGLPTITLSGLALRRLQASLHNQYEGLVHVSLSDEETMALAFVIIEALPIKK